VWPFTRDDEETVNTVDVRDAFARARRGAVLIDVRSAREWESGHAQGARHVPPERIASEATGLRRDDEVLVICASGHRSARAARALAQMGFRNVSNVAGGTHAWIRAGLPVRR